MKIIDTCYIKVRNRFFFPKVLRAEKSKSALDQEITWYDHRAGWLLDDIQAFGLSETIKKFLRLCEDEKISVDPYTCSQRIARAVYLFKLNNNALPERILIRSRDDAKIVAQFYEFRLYHTFMNNHLLNNYRALLLYLSYFQNRHPIENLKLSIENIERLIIKFESVLFLKEGHPVLTEGSVSYELHGLKILVDIACCESRTKLADKWRGWVQANGKPTVAKYSYKGGWMLPQVGNVTPNWTTSTMLDFVEGYYSPASSSIYRKIWHAELEALGQ